MLLGGLLLVAPMLIVPAESPFAITFGVLLLYVGYGIVLMALVLTRPGDGILGLLVHGRIGWALGLIGQFSYSIYLWHIDIAILPVQVRLLPHLKALGNGSLYWVVAMLVYIGLAVVGGVIMTLAVERPMLALRERLFPRSSIARRATRARGSVLATITGVGEISHPIETA